MTTMYLSILNFILASKIKGGIENLTNNLAIPVVQALAGLAVIVLIGDMIIKLMKRDQGWRGSLMYAIVVCIIFTLITSFKDEIVGMIN